MMDDIDLFISAIENSTRREIIRMLTQLERSYALELSKSIGLSQQAILKQLELLEKANLVTSIGFVPSDLGAKRKVYLPSGFSSVFIDYGRNFFDIRRLPIENTEAKIDGLSDAMRRLREINRQIDDLTRRRTDLIREKDGLISAIKESIDDDDELIREIVTVYLDTLSVSETAKNTGLNESEVMDILVSLGLIEDSIEE
ncbi:ArsR family transcriptional regulator [Thermoplasma sp.]|uniref:ArsR/SmtB family transcription factor n=1 Tax=Thermoplasma sp. TaxID=1973142 RepID=UPI00127090EC|nr:helix-turn-helix domain-containing protein [Thermoplasma sp.]KAA8922219.1 MAG: helix-turn-helix domain-containing protein [Thermoplasma sp.]